VKFVALGEVVEIKGGGTPSKDVADYWDGDIPWASVKDFKGMTLSSTVDRISASGVRNSATQIIPAGNIIVPTRMAVGKAAVNTIDMAINQDLKAILPGPKVQVRYLLYALLANAKLLEDQATGATVKGIKLDALRTLQIPLPPLEEQKRIAAILDQAGALRRLRARVLDRLNALGQAIFHEMFGDPRTNPMGWATSRLEDLGELERGVSKHRPRNDPALLGGYHALIQTGDVARAGDYIRSFTSTYSDLGLKQSRKWPKGTLCITIAANIADTAILGFDACFPDSVVGFNSGSEAMNFFVHRWFATVKSHLEQIAPTVAQKNINLAILRELPVIQPDLRLVEEFFRREAALHHQKKMAEIASSDLNTLFTSLQHRAFRGEL
jgi:type I restriction enzyme, S subunit